MAEREEDWSPEPVTPEGFEATYAALVSSRAYRAAVADAALGLPEWVVPYSMLTGALVDRFIDGLRLPSGAVLVDLGCGFGAGGLAIAVRTGASLIGVDGSPSAVNHAAAIARERGISAQFICASANATGITDATADGVIAVDALMFMDAASTIREVARILKPGARFVATAAEWTSSERCPVATVVPTYAPYFAAARLTLDEEETLPVDRGDALFGALRRHADALVAELPKHVAREFIAEANGRAGAPSRTRERWLVARKV